MTTSDAATPSKPKKVLTWIAQALLVLLLLGVIAFGALWFVGSRLPEEATVSVAMLIEAPINETFDVATIPPDYPSWRPEVTNVELLPSEDGNMRWREDWGEGQPVTLSLVELLPNQRMTVRIQDATETFSGTWTFEFAEQENMTRVQITEVGSIPNPVIRLIARRLVPGGAEHYPRLWLRHLATRMGDTTPEWVEIRVRVME